MRNGALGISFTDSNNFFLSFERTEVFGRAEDGEERGGKAAAPETPSPQPSAQATEQCGAVHTPPSFSPVPVPEEGCEHTGLWVDRASADRTDSSGAVIVMTITTTATNVRGSGCWEHTASQSLQPLCKLEAAFSLTDKKTEAAHS